MTLKEEIQKELEWFERHMRHGIREDRDMLDVGFTEALRWVLTKIEEEEE